MSSAPDDGPPDERAAEHDRSRHPHRQGPRTRRDEKGLADGSGWSPGAVIAIVLVIAGVALIIALALL
ncbi:hypothetical protein [Actinomycetospora cinnamomea]|uniref:Uncharacterized protein n=1 Tax=Actinomycetospora cinnamomea TaxID=663609 RepID=A0A2U1F3Y4_9PSEU|nr:hypothetical protein [Actinomycetospora cinnamomea]PVZ06895.1 hypothetical protein C8D89_11288 [Actinomycetospora cinnamomea]